MLKLASRLSYLANISYKNGNNYVKSKYKSVVAPRTYYLFCFKPVKNGVNDKGDYDDEEGDHFQIFEEINEQENINETEVKVFKYLPVPDHPLIPNFPLHLSLSKDQYEILNKEKLKKIATSVVQNEAVFGKEDSLALMHATLLPSIPKITSIKDVFKVGAVCRISIKENAENTFSRYTMSLMPMYKMSIEEVVEEPNPIGTVKVLKIKEKKLTIDDLDMEQMVLYRFLSAQYIKCLELAKDQKFKSYLAYIEQNFNIVFVDQFLNLIIACVSLPQFVNSYKFLTNTTVPQIQDMIEEQNLTKKLTKINAIFSDFVKKIELWGMLENEFDYKKDAQKTQEKLEEIYKSLKTHFIKETDERQDQVKRFRSNLEGKKVPEHIQKVIEEEINRYLSMEKYHSESTVIRTYLDYLTSLPYGISTEENLDIDFAKKVLDDGHYGMNDIKDRILEFIAVGKMKKSIEGKILCFVGPPGVGKTSIGESIAKSLKRKFVRIAVGGDKDNTVLKGFRRTYVGSVPGKIVQALKTTQTENPVILIDEVDKLGHRSMHGDPSGTLLEILDPEQNKAFTDDFLDIPIDLSKVLFLCTANILHTIPAPLLDRMEVIHVSGYTHDEKKHIYEKYLKPTAINKSGIIPEKHKFKITEDAVKKLIIDYCREPGVRSLQRYINRIFEKIAFQIVKNGEDIEVVIDSSTLQDFIGPEKFQPAKFYDRTPTGVVIGLAYNEYGGSILYIESAECTFSKVSLASDITNKPQVPTAPKMGSLRVTGSLGEVMKESASIANSYAKNFLLKYFIDKPEIAYFLDTHDVHVHVPEGAIPKDGPSAGVTLTTALLSLALRKPLEKEIAMTGEISLTGKVLPIGGVKEKAMAAQRENIKTLIFPKANEKDVIKLPDYIKNDLEIYFADHYEDVFRIVFPSVELK